MAMTAEEILEQIRALPTRERLHVIERAVAEVADETPAPAETSEPVDEAVWADMSDDEYKAFIDGVYKARAEPWRTFE